MRTLILGPDDPALNALKMRLDSKPELEASLEIVAWPEYRDRLMAALDESEASYQVVFVPGHVWLPELAQAGYLSDLESAGNEGSELVENLELELLPRVLDECRFKGKTYLVPLFTDGHILFYRQDLLDKEIRGDSISPLDLEALAAKAHHPPGIYGIALKAHPSEILLDWLPFLWECGGDILDAQGQPNFAGAEGIQALEAYLRLKSYAPPNTHEFGNAEIAQLLRQGKAAMASTWGGQAGPIFLGAGRDPRTLASEGGAPYRTAVFPHPWNATWGMAVPANQTRERRRQAVKVLAQACDPELDRIVIESAGSPVRSASYSQENLTKYGWLSAQKEMLERYETLPTRPETGKFLGSLYQAVFAAFLGEDKPKAALIKAEESVRKSLGL